MRNFIFTRDHLLTFQVEHALTCLLYHVRHEIQQLIRPIWITAWKKKKKLLLKRKTLQMMSHAVESWKAHSIGASSNGLLSFRSEQKGKRVASYSYTLLYYCECEWMRFHHLRKLKYYIFLSSSHRRRRRLIIFSFVASIYRSPGNSFVVNTDCEQYKKAICNNSEYTRDKNHNNHPNHPNVVYFSQDATVRSVQIDLWRFCWYFVIQFEIETKWMKIEF